MKPFSFYTALMMLVTLNAPAQKKVLRLYYEKNEVSSGYNFMRVDSLMNGLSANSFSIIGFADFLSSAAYNQQLSESRATAVRQYLISRHHVTASSIVQSVGRGEKGSRDNGSPNGEPAQRKVEIWYENRSAADLINVSKGENFTVTGLTFVPGRHTVSPEATGVMRQLLQTMIEHPGLKIEIQGHICCIDDREDGFDYDSNDYNLSTNRAKAIYDFLVHNGIDPARLSYVGFGHRKPLVKEKTPADEQINRRVEIRVIEK